MKFPIYGEKMFQTTNQRNIEATGKCQTFEKCHQHVTEKKRTPEIWRPDMCSTARCFDRHLDQHEQRSANAETAINTRTADVLIYDDLC